MLPRFLFGADMQRRKIHLIIADWGTSNLRLWALDSTSNILEKRQYPKGMARLAPDEFEPVLEQLLSEFETGIDAPVLICGMAGAAQGWQDAGYVDLADGVETIAAKAKKVETNSGRDVRVLPGMAQRIEGEPDVMRGEETLLLGANVLGLNYKTYCLPGTHSKWVFMDGDQFSSFNTIMTGEIFALLSEHSTLSHFLGELDEYHHDEEVFKTAVRQIIDAPETFTRRLFKLRAEPLLSGADDKGQLRARLSGWLIGMELAGVEAQGAGKIALVANGILEERYKSAFETLGIEYDVIDSEVLVLAGLKSAAKEIWG